MDTDVDVGDLVSAMVDKELAGATTKEFNWVAIFIITTFCAYVINYFYPALFDIERLHSSVKHTIALCTIALALFTAYELSYSNECNRGDFLDPVCVGTKLWGRIDDAFFSGTVLSGIFYCLIGHNRSRQKTVAGGLVAAGGLLAGMIYTSSLSFEVQDKCSTCDGVFNESDMVTFEDDEKTFQFRFCKGCRAKRLCDFKHPISKQKCDNVAKDLLKTGKFCCADHLCNVCFKSMNGFGFGSGSGELCERCTCRKCGKMARHKKYGVDDLCNKCFDEMLREEAQNAMPPLAATGGGGANPFRENVDEAPIAELIAYLGPATGQASKVEHELMTEIVAILHGLGVSVGDFISSDDKGAGLNTSISNSMKFDLRASGSDAKTFVGRKSLTYSCDKPGTSSEGGEMPKHVQIRCSGIFLGMKTAGDPSSPPSTALPSEPKIEDHEDGVQVCGLVVMNLRVQEEKWRIEKSWWNPFRRNSNSA